MVINSRSRTIPIGRQFISRKRHISPAITKGLPPRGRLQARQEQLERERESKIVAEEKEANKIIDAINIGKIKNINQIPLKFRGMIDISQAQLNKINNYYAAKKVADLWAGAFSLADRVLSSKDPRAIFAISFSENPYAKSAYRQLKADYKAYQQRKKNIEDIRSGKISNVEIRGGRIWDLTTGIPITPIKASRKQIVELVNKELPKGDRVIHDRNYNILNIKSSILNKIIPYTKKGVDVYNIELQRVALTPDSTQININKLISRLDPKNITGSGSFTRAVDVGNGLMQDFIFKYSNGKIISVTPIGKKFPQTKRFKEAQKKLKLKKLFPIISKKGEIYSPRLGGFIRPSEFSGQATGIIRPPTPEERLKIEKANIAGSLAGVEVALFPALINKRFLDSQLGAKITSGNIRKEDIATAKKVRELLPKTAGFGIGASRASLELLRLIENTDKDIKADLRRANIVGQDFKNFGKKFDTINADLKSGKINQELAAERQNKLLNNLNSKGFIIDSKNGSVEISHPVYDRLEGFTGSAWHNIMKGARKGDSPIKDQALIVTLDFLNNAYEAEKVVLAFELAGAAGLKFPRITSGTAKQKKIFNIISKLSGAALIGFFAAAKGIRQYIVTGEPLLGVSSVVGTVTGFVAPDTLRKLNQLLKTIDGRSNRLIGMDKRGRTGRPGGGTKKQVQVAKKVKKKKKVKLKITSEQAQNEFRKLPRSRQIAIIEKALGGKQITQQNIKNAKEFMKRSGLKSYQVNDRIAETIRRLQIQAIRDSIKLGLITKQQAKQSIHLLRQSKFKIIKILKEKTIAAQKPQVKFTQVQKQKQIQRQKQAQKQKQKQIQKQKQVQKQIQKQKQKQKQIQKQKQKLLTLQRQKQKQVQRQRQKLLTLQRQKLLTLQRQKQKQKLLTLQKKKEKIKKISKRVSKIRKPPIIPIKLLKQFTKKKLSKAQLVFYIKVKKRGRMVNLIPKPLLLKDAKDFLAFKLDKELLRTAYFEPIGQSKIVLRIPPKMRGYFNKVKHKLRPYKIKVGKKKALRFGFIEKRRFALDQKLERSQILRLRKKALARKRRRKVVRRKTKRKFVNRVARKRHVRRVIRKVVRRQQSKKRKATSTRAKRLQRRAVILKLRKQKVVLIRRLKQRSTRKINKQRTVKKKKPIKISRQRNLQRLKSRKRALILKRKRMINSLKRKVASKTIKRRSTSSRRRR